MIFFHVYRDSPTDRLGYGIDRLQAVQKHKWFDGFNWEGLHNRSLTPPIIPHVGISTFLLYYLSSVPFCYMCLKIGLFLYSTSQGNKVVQNK